jgi:hypothetical protein
MDVIDFPRRPRRGCAARPAPRPYNLALRMKAAADRRRALVAERGRLLGSLSRLERLCAEIESIQTDLERLRAALKGGPPRA